MSGDFPPLAEILPQKGPMRILERVVAHDSAETRCLALPGQSALYRDAAGRIPVWVAVEYMAQCAAADGSLRLRAQGAPLQPALFVGSRRLVFRTDAFDPATPLEVCARRASGRGRRFAFDCRVEDPGGGEPLAEGRLNVLLTDLPAVGAAATGDSR